MPVKRGNVDSDEKYSALSEVKDFIRDGLVKGYKIKEIKSYLNKDGIKKELIDSALKDFQKVDKKRIVLAVIVGVIGFIVVFMLAFSLTSILIVRNADTLKNTFGSGGALGTVGLVSSNAVNAGDYSVCVQLNMGEQAEYCKMKVAISFGDTSYCEKDYGNIRFDYATKEGKTVKLDASDYCWIGMSKSRGQSYCDKVSSGSKALCEKEVVG